MSAMTSSGEQEARVVPRSFEDFFEEATGRRAYVWQSRLANGLLGGEAPEWLCVPTGLGKTSILWCWAWALAQDLARCAHVPGETRRLPIRLHLIVDRRVVVDDTTAEAHRLQEALRDAAARGPAVVWVAEQLQRLSDDDFGEDAEVVQVRSLRGGLPRLPENVRHPVVPAVVTGTVDLVGSRLLWRGYGVARQRRPIEAALTGLDSWLVLDEAHMSGQLLRTLRVLAVQHEQETRLAGGMPGRWVTFMTATPPQGATGFELDWAAEFAQSPDLEQRRAQRKATLLTLTDSPAGVKAGAGLVATVAKVPVAPGMATLMFCNTPAEARRVVVAARKRPDADKIDVLLLVGGMPQRFRSRVLASLAPFKTGAPGRAEARGVLIVATQTLEVGADLDVDHLVTATASLEALVQRFGRANRVGARTGCTLTVHLPAPLADPDPVYGDSELRMRGALRQARPCNLWGFEHLIEQLTAEQTGEVTQQVSAVLPRHVFEAYVHTQGSPHEPAVARWLRPVDDPRAEVQVCFRDSLAQVADEFAVIGHLDRHPPLPDEVWTVPLTLARELVSGQDAPRAVVMDPSRSTPTTRLDDPASQLNPAILMVLQPVQDAFGVPGAGTDLSQSDPPEQRPFRLELLSVDAGDESRGDVLRANGELPTPLFTATGEDTGWVEVTPARMLDEVVPSQACGLDGHGRHVERRARAWASRLGLPPDMVGDIGLAARWHDEGKRAEIMQDELRFVLDASGAIHQIDYPEAIAKSLMPRRWWRRVRELAGVPPGYRHEAGSADAFDQHLSTVGAHDAALVRHLILTHHGSFRGCGPAIRHEQVPIPTYQDATTPQWAHRPTEFTHLNNRYGPYSLAFAEAIVRLADWHESTRLT